MNINKRLRRWPEGQHYPINDFFPQPVKSRHGSAVEDS